MGVLLELVIEARRQEIEVAAASVAKSMGLHLRTERDTGRLVFGGCSERALSGALALLRNIVGDRLAASAMLLAYRESVPGPADADYTYKMQSGGSGQFARVIMQVAPGDPLSGVRFRNVAPSENVPKVYVDAVERGVRDAAAQGGSLGWPLTDIDVQLKDGAFHDLDSSPSAFERAALGAVAEAVSRAEVRLLEPLATVAVLTPEHSGSAVASELKRRELSIAEVSSRTTTAIVASCRMFDLLGFEAELESITFDEGRATFILSGYAEIPSHERPQTTPAAAALRA
jgi:elongation factor G